MPHAISASALKLRRWLKCEPLEDRTVPAGSVARWNSIALDAVKLDHAIGGPATQFGPTRAARALAIVHAAIYDAVESIDRSYTPYKFHVDAPAGASLDAAVAAAARDTLAALYPTMTITFDAALANELSFLPTKAGQDGANVGRTIAAQVLADRANDHATDVVPYTPGTNPGDWTPDPLHPTQRALTPGWGNVSPFFMNDVTAFRAAAPPALNSPEYTAAYNELLALSSDGVSTPTQRTADQTEAGIYWGYDGQPGLCSPPRLYNQIARVIADQQGNDDVENARYFALINLAMADAGIAGWETKYFYNLWRPVTAIRSGDTDGNPDTAGIADWAPLGAPANNGGGTNFTPPFPAYVSGHATFGAATFKMIADFYGTDAIPFTFLSDEFNGKTFDMNGVTRAVRPRHFDTLSQAAEENGQSRIYLGIHWSFDKTEGIEQGNAIADYAFANFLQPASQPPREPPVVVAAAGAGGVPFVRVIDSKTGLSRQEFTPYSASFRGGVRLASGDFTDDGIADIVTAAGTGGAGHIRVFDGRTGDVLANFFAYDLAFRGGAYVAVGDVNGDGRLEIVTAAGSDGASHIEVFDGRGNLLNSFFAFDSSLRNGATVTLGDVNGDGRADIVVGAGAGDAPHVKTFDGRTLQQISDLTVFQEAFLGGVSVAAADLDGDGRAELVVGAGFGGGPHVRVLNAVTGDVIDEFFAYDAAFTGGVCVAIADPDGDGRCDIVVGAGVGGGPLCRVYDATTFTREADFFAFDPAFTGGINVAGPGRVVRTQANRDAAVTWNFVTLDAIRTANTPPPQASRALAMVSAAIFDAVNNVLPLHQFYRSNRQTLKADATAAASAAAFRVLSALYPTQQTSFDTALRFSLDGVPDGEGESLGVQLGTEVGNDILATRANDGSTATVTYTPGTQPGDWQPTPPAFASALVPRWGNVTPFAMATSTQFVPNDRPPDLTSDDYAQAYNQVKAFGSATSTVRTPEQTEIARYWADGGGTFTPPGHWNQIAADAALKRGSSLAENARLFAVLNFALADAAITTWSTKYRDDFWRPVTAIRAGDTDGNAGTVPDSNWTSLLTTPPFPAFTSGHSTFSATAATVLTAFFGDNYAFADRGDQGQRVTRSFANFNAAAAEAGMSRIYGGIHYSFDNVVGLATGRTLGQFVVQKFVGG